MDIKIDETLQNAIEGAVASALSEMQRSIVAATIILLETQTKAAVLATLKMAAPTAADAATQYIQGDPIDSTNVTPPRTSGLATNNLG